jgi:hypothetical protein
MQYPVKFISLAIFCLPLLAGLAAASWTRADAPCADAVARGWRWVGLATSVLIVGVCGVAWRSPVMGEDRLVTLRSGLQSALAVVLVLAGLAALRRLAQDRLRPWVSLGLLLVLAVDALTHMPNLAPTVSARVLEPRVVQLTPRARLGEARALPRAEAVRRAQANLPSDLFRHLGLQRLALMYSANLLEGIPVVTGFFPLYLGPAAEVVAIASESCPAGLADFLGIAQVTQPGALTSWQHRPTALPWVTAGQEPVFAGPVATLRALKQESFDPRRQVFLPTELGSQVQAKRAAQARVTCDQFAAHDVALRVETDAPTWVVIAQAFYPAWHAWVDGQPAPLHQANYAFQAVEVPAGSHQVQLRYQDRAFRAGAVLSGLTLLTLWVMMKRYGPGDGDSAEPSGRL